MNQRPFDGHGSRTDRSAPAQYRKKSPKTSMFSDFFVWSG